MRRVMLLVAGLVLLCTVLAPAAHAAPRSLSGALFGMITRPIGAVLGTVGRVRHGHAGWSRTKRNHGAVQQAKAPASEPTTADFGSRAAVGAGAAAVSAAIPVEAIPNPATRPSSMALTLPGATPALPSDEFQARGLHVQSGMRETLPLGAVGPFTWPTAYEDVIGFTLWPQAYGERFRVHGIGDVMSTIFLPNASLGDHPLRPHGWMQQSTA